ncbi:hypothetical protein ACLMK5_05195 [Streptococcus anginosus]|uniref:hypothetical protein n=1 Tax=Streptococcus anginosus TaxID=1328 RepID=UPI00301054C9
MNLNQIRILEACHKFLNGITLLKEELQNDNLVYQYNGKTITFDTYQECEQLTFIDYDPKFGYVDEIRVYISDRQNLINAFPNKDHLRALQKVSDEDQARIQIFKLLSQVNFEVLSEKYSNVKKDRFGYDFYNFETKENYPIYLFEDNAAFELVAIS